MRPRTLKKQNERFLLDTFLASANITAEVVDDMNESPDVIIRVGKDIVGVEISEIFANTAGPDDSYPLQARESLAQRIVTRASEIYRESGAQ